MILDSKKMLAELNKARSKFKSDSRIKECFHYNHDECNDKIIQAHSLQKNGVLNILESEENGNNVVYSFLHLKPHGIRWYGFDPIGKKSASTFHGFCGYHDTNLFKEIENNGFDIENDEHCFLLSYRSFAKEYHAKIETNKGFGTNEFFNTKENKEKQKQYIDGSGLAIRDMTIVKNKLNEALRNRTFDKLEYFTYSIEMTIPVAASSAISPSFSLDGTVLNKSNSLEDVYQNIIVTVLPTKTKTHVLLSYFPEDSRSVKYIDDIEKLNDYDLEKVISSILIGEIENTFISPTIWKKMNTNQKQQLMDELTLTMPHLQPIQTTMFISELNLFKPKYAIKHA